MECANSESKTQMATILLSPRPPNVVIFFTGILTRSVDSDFSICRMTAFGRLLLFSAEIITSAHDPNK